ncbi:glycoside hydrolase N-terminal domain-containing protein [Paenibacillus chondroitinus]|uniref:Glycoside hydrolase N-terminal domain-containing protein n=1 Tax=Paenibacillus chondroitinus TaxID=59842 RepID=A0ABU6D6L8_9BACL|nr:MULTISPECIES: glycoside hydrolase N-terminal domain-containing protein [Paenibacillus]MCY9660189.1 glycoside hydrolase family 95 protein [Paenibacillus anseongense]MEB4792952.1 glycoside hydrolase N-terminal domain-containing protein [Paenibacillus chondroitinus]
MPDQLENRNEDKLTMSYPASWWRNMWREAQPAGNGVLGASVFGGVQEETVLLNHAKLWHWGQRDELPDVSFTLERTRKLMDEGRYQEASWQLANALKEQGYGTKLASRFPLAAIRLTMPSKQAFRGYSRTLDMDSGEITVAWNDGDCRYKRKLFVSRADNCIVYAINGVGGSGITGEIGLQLHPSDRWADTPEYKELESSVETGADEAYAWYSAANDDGTDFGAVLRVVQEGGQTDGGQATGADGAIRFMGASRVLVFVKVFTHGKRAEDWPRLKLELADLLRDEEMGAGAIYEGLLERHVALHRPLYRSAQLVLGDEEPDSRSNERLLLDAYEGEASETLIRKMWAYGRYLFLSGTSTAEEAEPFGLYGLWGGDYRLVWSHNMANENIQMMYWHAHVGGLSELVPSLFRYYESLMEDFRDNARKLYGCRGIYIPAGTTAGVGVPSQIVPVILNWTGAAGWLAQHYVEHAKFTQEAGFLEERALPFMREALQFYKDFLVLDERGQYKIYPSVSPENTPLNYMPKDGKPLAHPMPTAINATMDIAILKELLRHLIEAVQTVGDAGKEVEEWQDMLNRLPDYRVNSDGAVSEWVHADFEDRYAHRHLSHLYPVFPGHEVTRETDSALFQAFEAAVRKREIGAQTGWSLAHMAAMYARFGDGDASLDCLDMMSRATLLPNLFTLHNDWRGMGLSMNMPTAPVQLDANLGWVNAIQEMLLQVSPGIIKLLPALPGRLKRGKLSRWRFHTGKVTMKWDTESGMFRAELTANRETDIVVKLPDWVRACTVTGGHVERSPLGEHYYSVKMKLGDQPVIFEAAGS